VEHGAGWPLGLVRLPPRPDLPGAACRAPGIDRAWFFPERGAGADTTKARKVCASCPVSGPCLEYALAAPASLAGVWAGTSTYDRRRLRRSILREHAQVLVPGGAPDDTEPVDTAAVALEPPATNGHAEVTGPSTVVEKPEAVAAAATNGHNGRACAQCGTALTGKQERFCGRACAKRFAHAARRASPPAIAHSRGSAPTFAQDRRNGTGTGGDSLTPPAAFSIGSAVRGDGATDRLGPVFDALMRAGATVSITVDNILITASRSEQR
jgi:hypothetical protein